MSKNLKSHPADEVLLDYAFGNLAEPESLIISAHSSYCIECSRKIEIFEALAGEMLNNTEPLPISKNLLNKTLKAIDNIEEGLESRAVQSDTFIRTNLSSKKIQIPSSIIDYLGGKLNTNEWSSTINNLRYFDIPFKESKYNVRMFEILPGKTMPKHGHAGSETTLVLHGGYKDENGIYDLGDIVQVNDKDVHEPVALDEGCLCLVISSGSIRFKGFFGSLLNLSRF